MNQIHKRTTFEPVRKEDLTESELKRAIESLTFLEEKREVRIKGRTCVFGSAQREHASREESDSPTADTEAMFVAGVIEAKEECDFMTLDMPNAFLQKIMPTDSERTIMKIRVMLVEMLIEISPEACKDYVAYDGNNDQMLYVSMLKLL